MGYPTDLTAYEFSYIASLFPERSRMDRPPWDTRLIVYAIFYVVKTGCQWRFFPKNFPPWQTVYGYFRKWHNSSVWFQMHERLRHKLRGKLGRDPHASVGIIDSQSVKAVLKEGTKAMTGAKR